MQTRSKSRKNPRTQLPDLFHLDGPEKLPNIKKSKPVQSKSTASKKSAPCIERRHPDKSPKIKKSKPRPSQSIVHEITTPPIPKKPTRFDASDPLAVPWSLRTKLDEKTEEVVIFQEGELSRRRSDHDFHRIKSAVHFIDNADYQEFRRGSAAGLLPSGNVNNDTGVPVYETASSAASWSNTIDHRYLSHWCLGPARFRSLLFQWNLGYLCRLSSPPIPLPDIRHSRYQIKSMTTEHWFLSVMSIIKISTYPPMD